jgi:hypothetical protein
VRERITFIEVSDHVRSKIINKHRVTEDEVEEACEHYIDASWDSHPEKGLRLLVQGRTAAARLLNIVLYPVDPAQGTWRLATAFED